MPGVADIKHPENLPNYIISDNSWKRNLLIISIAQFIVMIGMSSVIPFMPLYVRELGVSDPGEANIWSGLIFAGPYILSVITTPFWGAIGDKYGRKLMIIRSVFGLSVAVFFMAFVSNVYQLFALRVFQGAISGMIASALAFVSANTPNEKSGYAIGILQSSLSAGNIIGPFVGGIISDFFGIRNVFFLVSFLTFISGVLVILMVNEKVRSSSNIIKSSIATNLKYAMGDINIRFILILIVVSQAGVNYTNPIFPYFIEQLHAPAKYLSTITGSLVAIVGVMSIIFSPIWGKRNDKKGYKMQVMVASLIISMVAFIHPLIQHYIYLYPLRALAGIFFAAILPSLYAGLNKLTPNESKGGVMGIASSANLVGILIGYSTCGFLASAFGIVSTFIISGFLLLMVVFLLIKKNG
ncbi:multidrug efflux MFS transporter Lde [Candidatus Kapaibacterium sp.]